MLLSSVLLFAGTALGHVAGRDTLTRSCGVPQAPAELRSAHREASIQEATARKAGKITTAATTVNVYLHSVSATSGGLLSDSALQSQFNVLKSNFAPNGFNLNLAGTTKTVNTVWGVDGAELTMKKALRKGTYKDLNLYFLDNASGYLGYCYYPTSAPSGSTAFYTDGCTILSTTVPGGSSAPYNLGKTATHEAGHWFGLIHTFEDGCYAGDEVDDTPAQASESRGCPEGRDSCPTLAGLDPIHNYMDYSDDACYEEFTAGQTARMNSMWARYRA